MLFYRTAKTFAVSPAIRAVFRPWVKGLDNIPATGGAILAANHMSFSDSIFMPVIVPRPMRFLAKNDYWKRTGISGLWFRWLFNITGQIPMDRSGGKGAATSLSAGEQALRDGHLLGIYPEGTRSPDGRLYRGKLGVAKMALRTGVPVIPIALIGTDKVQPIERTVPRIRRVGMIIGAPMDFSEYRDVAQDRKVQRKVTDQIMFEIMRLSGQEYVDRYAQDVKKERQVD